MGIRLDGVIISPPDPVTGGAAWTTATIVVPYGKQYQEVTVIDAAILVTSKVFITWGPFTDADENTADMDDIEFNAVVNVVGGRMIVRVSTTNPNDVVGGTYKIMYLIG